MEGSEFKYSIPVADMEHRTPPLQFLCMEGSSKDRRSAYVLVWTKLTERVKEQSSMGCKE